MLGTIFKHGNVTTTQQIHAQRRIEGGQYYLTHQSMCLFRTVLAGVSALACLITEGTTNTFHFTLALVLTCSDNAATL